MVYYVLKGNPPRRSVYSRFATRENAALKKKPAEAAREIGAPRALSLTDRLGRPIPGWWFHAWRNRLPGGWRLPPFPRVGAVGALWGPLGACAAHACVGKRRRGAGPLLEDCMTFHNGGGFLGQLRCVHRCRWLKIRGLSAYFPYSKKNCISPRGLI